jgi:hypothetical protein
MNTTANPGRIAAFVGGGLAAIVALALLAAGGFLLWGNGHKDHDGYLTTGGHRFSTSTYALTSGDMDLNLHGGVVGSDRYGTLRLKATAGQPIFLGIAPSRDVSAYLSGTAHASIDDLDFWPFRVSYGAHPGTGRPLLPAQQDFWSASTHGAGTQTLSWKVRHGNWSIVVMNADGSPGVAARVSAGAKVPFLAPAGWSALGGGILFGALSAALLVLGARRRPAPPAMPAVAVPA